MDERYKFEIGQDVIVVNIDGRLRGTRFGGLRKLIGTEAKITDRVIDTILVDACRYTLNIPCFLTWWFSEGNLEAVETGFDAESIIRSAFDL